MRVLVARVRMIAVLMFSLHITSTVVFADPLEDGQAAYNRGDYATALNLLRPLAEQGDSSAQNSLGWMYEQGHGVTQDFKEATKWYRSAAEQGLREAQYNLGVIYFQGRGTPSNFREALKWYRKAATQGDAQAQYNLGFMYVNGVGVPKDLSRGHMWWDLASKNGEGAAWGNLDALTKIMTKDQIARAQEMEQKCETSKYTQCD
jgi:uncharacterized protein